MRNGQVSDYAADMEMGVIKTHDQNIYIFAKPDWLDLEIMPKEGLSVTFEAAGRSAKKISIQSKSS